MSLSHGFADVELTAVGTGLARKVEIEDHIAQRHIALAVMALNGFLSLVCSGIILSIKQTAYLCKSYGMIRNRKCIGTTGP